MKNRNKLILGLLFIGVISFSIMLFIISQNNTKKKQYINAQFQAETSDVNYILPYKNKYMGNSSNVSNLFYHLPLSGSRMKFELFPDTFTVKINFEDTVRVVGKTNLKDTPHAMEGIVEVVDKFYKTNVYKSLIYNSTAAFALIDNLEALIYHFSDITYRVNRSDVVALYSDFDNILNETNWKEYVQTPLKNDKYIEAAKSILIEIK
jgi:hypothetical protein